MYDTKRRNVNIFLDELSRNAGRTEFEELPPMDIPDDMCLSLGMGENYFWTDPMELKISHDDLHLLLDPLYLFLGYSEEDKVFYLVAVQDESNANIKLTPAYYEWVRSETAAYPKGDYGPNMYMTAEFISQLKELGWEVGKAYRVPCALSVQEVDGVKTPVLTYDMNEGYQAD